MQLPVRDMPYWDDVPRSPKCASWRWWPVPCWGSSYEHGRAADAFPVFAEPLANRGGLLGMPQHYAVGSKEFLLRLSGSAPGQAAGALRRVRLYAEVR